MASLLASTILRDLDNLLREIHTIYEASFRTFALQKGQFAYLTRIYENAGINLAELSFNLKVDKTTTTKAVQKLINSGFVTKIQDESDKRVWHLYPTTKTQKLYYQIIAEKNRVLELCFENFSEDEKSLLGSLINRVANNIANEWKKITHNQHK